MQKEAVKKEKEEVEKKEISSEIFNETSIGALILGSKKDVLGSKKSVTLIRIKGEKFVEIKELGRSIKPGRKGVLLNKKEWDDLKKIIDLIDEKMQ